MKLASRNALSSIFVLGVLVFSSNSAFATAYQGYVSGVFALDGRVMIRLTGGYYDGATASCGGDANQVNYMADPAAPYGRVIISIALGAKLSGRLVWARGDGACGSGFEGINALDLKG